MSQIIGYIVAFGVLLGGIDKLRGNKWGYGAKFDEAFALLAPTAFSMVGIICLSPYLSMALEYGIAPMLRWLKIDPSMIAGVLAIDMGGYQLAENLADNPIIGQYAGTVLAATLGCTLVFTIPVGVGMIEPEDQPAFARGIVIGLFSLPATLILGGLLCGLSLFQVLWQNLLPFGMALLCGIGFWKFTRRTLWLFQKYVSILQVVLVVGLMLGAIAHLCELPVSLELVPILDAMETVASISIFLLGSLPVTLLLQRLLGRPFEKLGRRLGLDQNSMMGCLVSCVSPLPTLSMLKQMDFRGKVMNVAFIVSATSAIGAHLAFMNTMDPELIFPLLISKVAGGLIAVIPAYFVREKV